MPLATRLSTRSNRPARARGGLRARTARIHVATESAKRAGGPEDLALYRCHCGYAFKAHVTTTVGCPECGTEQAW